MEAAVLELLADPTLPAKVALFRRTLDAERERRERFYDEIDDSVKAEFINGEVIMHSPAMARHTEARGRLYKLLHTYVQVHKLGIVHDEKSLCVFPRNDYEPDVVFFGPKKAARIRPKTLKFPVPDFVCEMLSDSTEQRDRGVKFEDYQAQGVGEYWMADCDRKTIEQYLPRGGRYELALKSGSGEIESAVMRGFRIPIRAIFDDAENLRALRAVLA